ncbi:Aspartokinase [bioreactor metagenome]|uniref:aspartate kinase n=1 Tax=bioreactor metagenome TaxID=1076179 RepID=A0A645JHY3_9ZZZZ
MVFTVASSDLSQARTIVEKIARQLEAIGTLVEEDVAKVSVVGAGMFGSPGIAAAMFGALSEAQVNIEVISTSEISISCLIKESQVKEAVNAIHAKFFPTK